MVNKFNLASKDLLSKGSIFKGKIIDILASKVLIEVKDGSIIPATLDSNVDISIGDELTFLVKASDKNEILIKSMNQGDLEQNAIRNQKKSDSSILKLLKNMNIEENELSVDIIKNLIKANVNLNRENINNSIKMAGKIEQLTSLSSDEKVIVLNELKSEDLSNFFVLDKTKIKSSKATTDKETNSSGRNIEVKVLDKIIGLKSDIKNILIVKGKSDLNENDININMKNVFDEDNALNLKQNLPKLIALFVKNDIKPTLNNIINMQELNNDPKEYIKNLNKVKIAVNKELDEKTFKELFANDSILIDDNTSSKKMKFYSY